MDYNPIVADVDHWIRNNCASWSTEAVIVALIQMGYISTTKAMEWLQDGEQALKDRIKELNDALAIAVAVINQHGDIFEEMEAKNERLRKKVHDILLVDTTDGMTASEWVARTAKAEAENERYRIALQNALVASTQSDPNEARKIITEALKE